MTERQNEVFLVIDEYWKKFGYGPSIDDIMYQLGAKSRGNIHRIINRLVEMGACKKEKGRFRSVRPSGIRFRSLV
jgi:SOS-response transcriptional repressor LexA